MPCGPALVIPRNRDAEYRHAVSPHPSGLFWKRGEGLLLLVVLLTGVFRSSCRSTEMKRLPAVDLEASIVAVEFFFAR